jgi:hypothetical protein
MIPLTRNEIAHLTAARWSIWRRRHQHTAAPTTTSAKPPEIHDGNDLPPKHRSSQIKDP